MCFRGIKMKIAEISKPIVNVTMEDGAVTPEEGARLGFKEKQKGYSDITIDLCNGCGQCAELCKFDAITLKEDK